MAEKGMLIIVSAPSGTGKGAIIEGLVKQDPKIIHSVSATTREPRNDEEEDKSYFFISTDEFRHMIEKKELLEWDEYCGNFYGTPKQFILDSIEKGQDVILDITVAGALDIKKEFPEAIMIFVLPPSLEELKKRIGNRGTEDEQSINKRMKSAYSEIRQVENYEYVLINDKLEKAISEAGTIIAAERMKYKRNLSIIDKLYKGELK
jgi:guanylate kinase